MDPGKNGEIQPLRRQRKSLDEALPSRQSYQQEVYKDVLKKLTEAGCEAVRLPNFADDLLAHFMRLPNRYALDVNTDRADDVLLHQKLLQLAEIPENRPVFHVRAVRMLPTGSMVGEESLPEVATSSSEEPTMTRNLAGNSDLTYLQDYSVYAPAFGRLESLSIERLTDGANVERPSSRTSGGPYPVHEVTFSTIDKTKLLSQLSALLADVGLNIREAHVFSTTDGYSLDVFIVHGWHIEEQCRAQQC